MSSELLTRLFTDLVGSNELPSVVARPQALPARPPTVGREANFGHLTERPVPAAPDQRAVATLTGDQTRRVLAAA